MSYAVYRSGWSYVLLHLCMINMITRDIPFIRFCRQETSCYQDDYYPKQCYVKVNGQYCPIPVSIAAGA